MLVESGKKVSMHKKGEVKNSFSYLSSRAILYIYTKKAFVTLCPDLLECKIKFSFFLLLLILLTFFCTPYWLKFNAISIALLGSD